jgi:tubulin polyglutamylase TTLL6/13
MRKAFAKDYNFFPPTWSLPTQRKELQEEIAKGNNKTYIVKPEALSQGKGIFLIRNLDKVPYNEHYVVQRYITKPYLIEGLKFDLRIYVLVYGCDPLRIFLFKEGLTRLATEKYVKPTRFNMENLYMHLTNYAINKNSKKFVFNVDADNPNVGHKRSLEFVWKYIDANGGDSRSLRRKIKRAIIKSFCAVQPQLKQCLNSCLPFNLYNNTCFEVLGFDIMLDHKLKPWLLEVNNMPSLCTDSPFDNKVKTKLITDTIRILNITAEKKVEWQKKEQERIHARVFDKERMTKEEKEVFKQAIMDERDEYELEHCGDFTRIYPDEKLDAKYQSFIDFAAEELEQSYGVKKHEVLLKPKESARKNSIPLCISRPKTGKRDRSIIKGLNDEAVKEKLGAKLYTALKPRTSLDRSVLIDKKDTVNTEKASSPMLDALLAKEKKSDKYSIEQSNSQIKMKEFDKSLTSLVGIKGILK